MSAIADMLKTGVDNNLIVFTPEDIAKEMVDIIPDDVFNTESKFIDITCKSGIYLKVIKDKLMKTQSIIEKFPDENERLKHILTNQLYALTFDKFTLALTQRNLYGQMEYSNNIKCIDNYIDKYIKSNKIIFKNTIENLFKTKEVKGEAGEDMKFDVVIGNPPYNRGMDLDFVNKGFDLSTQYCVMITPAKWQTAAANQRVASKMNYGEFRENLVPHMSKVVFYPDCSDIFQIGQIDGIAYYILDKIKPINCTVVNKSRLQNKINSEVKRSIKGRESLLNVGDEVVKFLGQYSTFKISRVRDRGRYEYWINKLFSLGGGSPWDRVLLTLDGKCKVLGAGYIIDSAKGEKCQAGVSQLIFKTDDFGECESFVSWLNCKFTRFFVLMNISKLTCNYDDDYFRFVPAPPSGKFDHIYTDEELYKAFNLPQKYIDVIEAVIKERK